MNIYVKEHQKELVQLIKDLCEIPSFSHHEQQKAEYIRKWFFNYGIEAKIDEASNVIVEYKGNTSDYIAFAAHIDTVFNIDTITCIEQDDYLYGPGVGDDTANVAELMVIVRYLFENNYTSNQSFLFVFNSCEEGLGNLKGSKYLFEKYSISEFYSFDLGYDEIICKAVGSLRYAITVETEGGHSYSDFGNKNAIVIASELISELYTYQVPTRGKSTYNVGIIEGGTSVNTIAQIAKFFYEIRSDHREDLQEMKEHFFDVISKYDVKVEVLGERPCMGDVDENRMHNIVHRVSALIHKHTGNLPKISSGSTDCNVSYAHGVCGCCFGGYLGGKEHTLEEWISLSSLEVGMNILMEFVVSYFK